MTLLVNGESRDIDSVESVEQFVARLFPDAAPVLVEHNGVALRRNEWSGRQLGDGDRIEIIRVVAGG